MSDKPKLTSEQRGFQESDYSEENEYSTESLPKRNSRREKPKKEKRIKEKRVKEKKEKTSIFKRKKPEDLEDEFLMDEDDYDDFGGYEEDKKSKKKPKREKKVKQPKAERTSMKEKLKQKPTRTKKTKIDKKPRISVDIGNKYIKIVEGMYDGRTVSIRSLATVPTPENSYSDGAILDPTLLTNALNNVIRNSGMNSKEIIYTMESKSIISREVDFPSIVEKDIKQMINFQVDEYFPVNLDDYILQSKIVEQINTDEKKESKLSVSILPKVMCEQYLSLTDALALKPIALDMNANSVYKLLSEHFKVAYDGSNIDNKTIAILDIGHVTTNVIIVENGIFRFSRLVEAGGGDIDSSIGQLLNTPPEKIEEVKMSIGGIQLPVQVEGEVQTETEQDYIRNIVRDSLSKLCEEVERILRYHTVRDSGNRIDEIYIYGATSRMLGIEKYIENALNTPTYKIDALDNVRLGKRHRDEDIMQYANAIGAIIRM